MMFTQTIHKIDSLSVTSKPIKRWYRAELFVEKNFLNKDDKRNQTEFMSI